MISYALYMKAVTVGVACYLLLHQEPNKENISFHGLEKKKKRKDLCRGGGVECCYTAMTGSVRLT